MDRIELNRATFPFARHGFKSLSVGHVFCRTLTHQESVRYLSGLISTERLDVADIFLLRLILWVLLESSVIRQRLMTPASRICQLDVRHRKAYDS